MSCMPAMKKLLAISLLLLPLTTLAQDGWFLGSSIGMGVTNVRERTLYPFGGKKTGIFSLVPELNIGYRLRNLRLSVGISYYRTGYSRKNFDSMYIPPSLTLHEVDMYCVFRHVAVPMKVTSEVNLSKRLNLSPFVGVDISFNQGQTYTYRDVEKIFEYSVANTEFYDTYHGVSLFGNVGANLEYKTDRMYFFIGPSGKYMLGDFLRKPYNLSLHNYAFYMNLGVVWFPGKRKAQ